MGEALGIGVSSADRESVDFLKSMFIFEGLLNTPGLARSTLRHLLVVGQCLDEVRREQPGFLKRVGVDRGRLKAILQNKCLELGCD